MHRAPCNTPSWRLAGCLVLALLLGAMAPLSADEGLVDPKDMPGPLKEVGFNQKIGDALPLDAKFVDEAGKEVTLGDYFGERPVILAFVYYDCPMLCSLVMNGLAKSVGVLEFNAGDAFDVVAVSVDPTDTPAKASKTKLETIQRYGRPETAEGWHFLSGQESEIQKVAQAAGFEYTFIPETGDYAHAAGILLATVDGTISQYYYGIEYSPKDLRLAMVEASENRLGSVVDQILLYCYRYNPSLGKYTAVITRVLRLAGLVFLLCLATFLWINWRRDRAHDRKALSRRASAQGATLR